MPHLFKGLQHFLEVDGRVDALNLRDALTRVALLNADMNNTFPETGRDHLVILSIVKARFLSG